MANYKPGAEIEVGYPFAREMVNFGEGEFASWRPGTRQEQCAPDDFETVADALGTMIVTVVATFKPGKFPERVFFTRRWRDPSGREFGKGKLHTKTAGNFTAMLRGYRHHFEMSEHHKAIEG